MNQDTLVEGFELKLSPAYFVQWLLLIEFFLPVLSLLLVFLLDLEGFYRPIVGLSFSVFFMLLLTSVEVALILGAFMLWYTKGYRFGMKHIEEHHRFTMRWRELLETPKLEEVTVEQGRVGRYFDYGTLHLHTPQRRVALEYIPQPFLHAKQLRHFISPQDRAAAVKQQPLAELLLAGEGQYLEYKSSFVWDYRRKVANKGLRVSVIKTLAAFMNSAGGVLLIGVDDAGEILGIEADFVTQRKQDVDGWENTFNTIFNQMIGAESRRFVSTVFKAQEGKTVCILAVSPTPYPVFVTDKGEEAFYVRAGNGTQSLSLKNALRYVQTRFEI